MTYIYISLFLVIILYLIVYAYIKITYKFWAYQPVFHIYNLYYWLFPPGLINQTIPEKNKFVNLTNVITTKDITDENYNDALSIIQKNYLRNKKSKFFPKIENFKPYFIGHNGNVFFTFYQKDNIEYIDDKIIENKFNIGFMSSRPLYVYMNDISLYVSYVDYLCVDKKYRKEGIAPQIIQTHVYNSRRMDENLSVYVFKREADLTGIVPITIYYNYLFDILKWKKPQFVSNQFKTFEINTSNLHLLYDLNKIYLKEIFSIYILPQYSNILELIKSQNIIIYCSTIGTTIVGFYFFKNTCTEYKNFNIIECFASVCINQKYKKDFVSGFHSAVFKIFKSKNFKYLIIENVSHNYLLIKKIIETKIPVMVSPSAFYFYNYAITPIAPHNFFAIY